MSEQSGDETEVKEKTPHIDTAAYTAEELEQLFTKLKRGKVDSRKELDRIYRVLSKHLHPDITGGDGQGFIRLREYYERAEANRTGKHRSVANRQRREEGGAKGVGPKHSSATSRRDEEEFDPFFIVVESGFSRSLGARGCLYVSLRRFYSLGMHNYRIRTMEGLKKRNGKVLRSVFHWGYLYDTSFPPIFAAYTQHHLQPLSTTKEVKDYNFARRLFSDGVSGFFNYQHTGRKGTGEIAADKFAFAEKILLRCVGEPHPLIPLSRWYAGELERPPALFG